MPTKLISTARDVEGTDPLSGLDVAAAGHALLAAQGVTDPSEAELALAYTLAGADRGRSASAVPATAVRGAIVAKANAILAKKRIFEPTEQEFLAAVADASRVLDEPATGYRLTGVVWAGSDAR